MRACAFLLQLSFEGWELGTPRWLLGLLARFPRRARRAPGSIPRAAPCRCPRGARLGPPMCYLLSDAQKYVAAPASMHLGGLPHMRGNDRARAPGEGPHKARERTSVRIRARVTSEARMYLNI